MLCRLLNTSTVDTDSDPNRVDDIQPMKLSSPELIKPSIVFARCIDERPLMDLHETKFWMVAFDNLY